MLVEGGYLHSMKLMIEKASAASDRPDPRPTRGWLRSRLRRRRPFSIAAPLKRLSVILLGSSFQS
jgi:hypothetical protein